MKRYEQLPWEAECLICHETRAQRLWSVDSQEAAQHYVLRERDLERHSRLATHIELLWGQERCEVVQCHKCGFCYSQPYVAGDEKFYELAYDGRKCPREKWEFQVTRDVLEGIATPETRLLEIGAGDGAFIRSLPGSLIRKENILCTEYSEYGKRQIEDAGVKCYLGDIRSISDLTFGQEFDTVCMFQVLEHMDRLDELFRKLNRLMKTGGSLFIAVPNADRIEFNELNGALRDMPPNHIGRWNRNCLEEMGKKHGFRLHDYRVEPYHFGPGTKQFVAYRYLQKSQRRGSLENSIEIRKNEPVSQVMRLLGIAVNLIAALPLMLNGRARVGDAQWAHLVKQRNAAGD